MWRNSRLVLMMIVLFVVAAAGIPAVFAKAASHDEDRIPTVVLNPYENVDWKTVEKHKAALHLHTLQSDGVHMVDEVIKAYRSAGFTVLSITDHDCDRPNVQVRMGKVSPEKASPYPKNPKTPNFFGSPTWPWTDYGSSSPKELEMIGIQGNELTHRHHINSYYNDYGLWYDEAKVDLYTSVPYKGVVDKQGNEIWEDDQLFAVAKNDGLAILNHPGISDTVDWWERKPLKWYVQRFKKHPLDCLIGMEITNAAPAYQQALWDQLLARFMPSRPVWGLGTDDMHKLSETAESFTTLLLDEFTDASARKALENGTFFFFYSTKKINYLQKPVEVGVFPSIKDIVVDKDTGTITIKATHYNKIKWISSPKSLDPVADYKKSDAPWPLGQVVHTGRTLNYRDTPNIKNYVRVELQRTDGKHTYHTFTNPFGIVNKK